MKQFKLKNSQVTVSEQILGCWVMGGSYWGGAEDSDSVAAINAATESGITTFDTAFIYGNGRSERVLGAALKGHERSKLTIIDKLWTSEMAASKVAPACEASLAALQMDYLDVYFIHYPSPDGVPIGETMEELNKLKEAGKIRCIGLSNFNLQQHKEAEQYGEIDVVQPCYSAVWRAIDGDEFDYYKSSNIAVVPYSTLAQGILTGKFNKATTFPIDDGRSAAPLFQTPYYEGALAVAEQLKPYAEKYNKTLAQIAINWLINKDGITAPIVGGRNAQQVKENIVASSFTLSPEDCASIDKFSSEFTKTLPHFKNFFDATIID